MVEEIVARIGGQVRDIGAHMADRTVSWRLSRRTSRALRGGWGRTPEIRLGCSEVRAAEGDAGTGGIPYTVWDFPFRGDYGGDGSYHGNCSHQIIEQCVWRLTERNRRIHFPASLLQAFPNYPVILSSQPSL